MKGKQLPAVQPTPEEPKLSGRRLMFAMEYLVDLNGSAAYIRAGYKAKNGDVAKACASRLLTDANVRAFIQAETARRRTVLGLTGETIVRELLCIARADIAAAFRPDGTLKPMHEIPEDTRRAIAAVDVVEMAGGMEIEVGKPGSDGAESGGVRHVAEYTKKVKFWPKDKALELLGKHLGVLVDVNVGGTVKHEHTHRLTKEQADAAYRGAGITIEGEKVAA